MLAQEMANIRVSRDLNLQDPDTYDVAQRAVNELLMVMTAYSNAASAIRISEPLREYELASWYQELKLGTVDFNAQTYLPKVAAPTPSQLQEFFDKYKDQDSSVFNARSTTNPFGFGYKYLERVKLQYLLVPQEEVRKAAMAKKSKHEWEVEARKYHTLNSRRFQVETPETTGIDPSGLSVKNAPTATTKPFGEVEKEALEAVLAPEILSQRQSVVSRIISIMRDDWTSYHQPKAGQKPQTSMGVDYGSYEYLQKLAELIQKQFKIAIVVEQLPQWSSVRDLEMRDAIGRSQTNSNVKFPMYATLTADSRKILQQNNPGLPQALQILEPSMELHGLQDDAIIFRVTARDAAHVPQTVGEVAQAVERDYKLQQAFELAKKAADVFAKEARLQGFAHAASANSFKLMDTGVVSRRSPFVSGLNLSDAGNEVFLASATKTLLTERAAGDIRPVAAIEIPHDTRVIVAQLQEVSHRWTPQDLPDMQLDATRRATMQYVPRFVEQWFDYKSVVQRTNFQPRELPKHSDTPDEPQPQGPSGPLGL